ncbi:MAG: ribonucleoside hydrolase RihC [Clostridiales bacterium]|nr:ribonucleoside hydrolase RihC [Clostridiales bacterium]
MIYNINMEKKKHKIIIDTDPGVDDSVCLIYALTDEHVETLLLTTVVGNISIETATRNALHLLDVLQKDVPVAKGQPTAMFRKSATAEFIHQKEGLGGYIPPATVKRKTLDIDAVEAMYQTLKAGDGDITILALGPQTNLGVLLSKHPDIIPKIPKIVFMGGSPFGMEGYPDHISFNISCDPEAFQIVLDSGIPLVMLPSDVGRRKAHLDEAYVNRLQSVNDLGRLMYTMYGLYWEPGYPDKRVATNDVCALFALVYPNLFTTKKCKVTLDLHETPGKTFVEFCEDGNVELVTQVDRENFIKRLDEDLQKLSGIKI